MRSSILMLNLTSKTNKVKKAKASELTFISVIKRDGSGTEPVNSDEITNLLETFGNQNREHELRCLSMSQGTFILSEFNSYVVKLKEA